MIHDTTRVSTSNDAGKLVVSYWLTATLISVIAIIYIKPTASMTPLFLAPLLPTLPIALLTSLVLPPTANPLPLSFLLAVIAYLAIFVALTKSTRTLNAPPLAVGLLAGVVNGLCVAFSVQVLVSTL